VRGMRGRGHVRPCPLGPHSVEALEADLERPPPPANSASVRPHQSQDQRDQPGQAVDGRMTVHPIQVHVSIAQGPISN
jgi:hypothetical protein